MSRTFAVAIAGLAGSGKTTLGRAIAAATGAPLLDLDTVTNPLLDHLPKELMGEHWLAGQAAAAVRAGRYAALCATAGEVRGTAGSVVMVAPFTAELRGGDAWRSLVDAAGNDLKMIRLVGDPQLLARRRSQRQEARDRHRPNDDPVATPAVPHIDIDVELSTAQQVSRALVALGLRAPVDGGAALFGQTFEAVLFDLDGTLVDSTASVARSWRRLAEEHGVTLASLEHGRTAASVVREVLPDTDPDEALARIRALEIEDAPNAVATVGAHATFASVPADLRAVVTSGSRLLATARLAAAGILPPEVFVTSDDVGRGKPDPEPFLLAAQQLGVDPQRCLVVEDAPAGIAAAKAAGCQVLAVSGTCPPNELRDADLLIDALDAIQISMTPKGVALRIARPQA